MIRRLWRWLFRRKPQLAIAPVQCTGPNPDRAREIGSRWMSKARVELAWAMHEQAMWCDAVNGGGALWSLRYPAPEVQDNDQYRAERIRRIKDGNQ